MVTQKYDFRLYSLILSLIRSYLEEANVFSAAINATTKNIVLRIDMLGQRLRLWPSIYPVLGRHIVLELRDPRTLF